MDELGKSEEGAGAEEGLRQDSRVGRLRLQHPGRNSEPRSRGSDHNNRAVRTVREAKNFDFYAAKGVVGVVDEGSIFRETGILTDLWPQAITTSSC
jgi:hypothetical protein